MGLMNKWMYGHPDPETLPLKDERRRNYTIEKFNETGRLKETYDRPFAFMGYTVWKGWLYMPGFDPEVDKKKQIILKEQEKIEREKIRKKVRRLDNENGFKGVERGPISNDDAKIRPQNFTEFVGQENATAVVKTMVEAVKKQNGCLRHLIMFGPAGVGKTALSLVIANELDTNVKVVNSKTLKDTAGLLNLFSKIKQVTEGQGTIIQMDEIDLLDIDVAKQLHRALEEFKIEYQNEEGEFVQIGIPSFTLLGTTNNLGKIDSAFLSRTYEINFQDYTAEEISLILHGISHKLGLPIEEPAKKNLAKRCRGNPRQAVMSFQLVRDIVKNTGGKVAKLKDVIEAMRLLGIDENGFTRLDLKALQYLQDMPQKRASERAMADAVDLDIKTYRAKVESYLKKTGMILVTGRGRTLTEKGEKYVK